MATYIFYISIALCIVSGVAAVSLWYYFRIPDLRRELQELQSITLQEGEREPDENLKTLTTGKLNTTTSSLFNKNGELYNESFTRTQEESDDIEETASPQASNFGEALFDVTDVLEMPEDVPAPKPEATDVLENTIPQENGGQAEMAKHEIIDDDTNILYEDLPEDDDIEPDVTDVLFDDIIEEEPQMNHVDDVASEEDEDRAINSTIEDDDITDFLDLDEDDIENFDQDITQVFNSMPEEEEEQKSEKDLAALPKNFDDIEVSEETYQDSTDGNNADFATNVLDPFDETNDPLAGGDATDVLSTDNISFDGTNRDLDFPTEVGSDKVEDDLFAPKPTDSATDVLDPFDEENDPFTNSEETDVLSTEDDLFDGVSQNEDPHYDANQDVLEDDPFESQKENDPATDVLWEDPPEEDNQPDEFTDILI